MSDERRSILDLLKSGKISVTEADDLLTALTQSGKAKSQPIDKRFFRVHVREGEKTTVNINVPLSLAEVGIKLIPEKKLSHVVKDVSISDIMAMITAGQEGNLIDIETEDDGVPCTVRVSIS